jgi:feruloyl esterase
MNVSRKGVLSNAVSAVMAAAGCLLWTPATAQTGCAGLAGQTIAGALLAEAKSVDADALLPRHCIVTGSLNPRTGSDGKSYAIKFEMRLPAEWNGRFWHQLNGGNDGEVVPALGDRPEFSAMGGKPPLARGFATLSSDSGHQARDPVNASFGLAAGAAFGLEPQARRDYGYSADVTLAPVAQAILTAHYGRKADYSYMYGCSNGGRHAMVAASRMPEAYDGFLVGNPGFNLPKAAIQHAWDVQHLTKIDPDIRRSITRDDAKLLSSRIVEACDAADGLKDGITANLSACQKSFDWSRLRCTGTDSGTCFTDTKISALKSIFTGPKNSKGEALYADWPVDGGVGTGNWRAWKVESPVAAWQNYPIIATMGAASLALIFSTPPKAIAGDNASLLDYLAKFDFDTDAPKILAKDAAFSESSMEFMTPPDLQLSSMRKAGRKMIVFHGQADPVFSVNDTIAWHEQLNRNAGGQANAFARLFALPGVTHCGGGVGLDRFDGVEAITAWVEKGQAPDQLITSASPGNREIPDAWSRSRSRPACPWPAYARYQGGNEEDAASFVCSAP